MLGAVNGPYLDGNNKQHGWVRYPNGTIQTFDAPGAQATFGGGINNLGVIAGGFLDTSTIFHGLIRAANGTITTFDAPGAGTEADMFFGTVPTANNDFGVIAGYSVDNNNVSHGFIRFPNANIKVFDVKSAGSGNGQGTVAWGLNEVGEITGILTDTNNVNHGYIRAPDFCR